MCRRYAEPLVVATLALLGGCGLMQTQTGSMPESPSDASVPNQTIKDAATGAQVAAPPEAARQFEAAVAMLASGNTAGAESEFRALAAAYPTFAAPLVNLAILQVKAGRLDEAEKTLKDATARNADSAPAFNQLGIVYRHLGRFKEADDAYQRALALDADYASAWLNLGVLCDLYLQQPQRALEAYERYLALAAAPDAKVSGWVTELKARLGTGRSARAE